MERISPEFIDKVKNLGAFDINVCYSCGNCTAICPLCNEKYSFPRKMIRYSLLGLTEKITTSPEIWLCYHCGQCSDTCPREADPGELMMALRRWVIRRYSLGRIADLFYNRISAVITWLLLTIAATLGIIYFHNSEPNLEKVEPLSFISLDFLHDAGIIMGIFVAFFALAQILIMARSIRSGKKRESLVVWMKSFVNILFNEVFIQKKFRECEEKYRYLAHLALFWGFSGLFLATCIVFGVDFFGFPESLKILAKVLGIISGVVFLYGTSYYIFNRVVSKDSYSKYSHHSDWVFLILLFLGGVTGFVLDIFEWVNLPWPAYITFAIHLVIVFDLLIAAPFTKFAHAMYRPLAIWLAEAGEK